MMLPFSQEDLEAIYDEEVSQVRAATNTELDNATEVWYARSHMKEPDQEPTEHPFVERTPDDRQANRDAADRLKEQQERSNRRWDVV